MIFDEEGTGVGYISNYIYLKEGIKLMGHNAIRSYVIKHKINVIGIILNDGHYYMSSIVDPDARDMAFVLNILLIDKHSSVDDLFASNDINNKWWTELVESNTIPKKYMIFDLITEEELNPGFFWDTSPEPWVTKPMAIP